MRKDTRLNIRVTPQEKLVWAAAAAADGRKLSDWIRWTLCRESMQPGVGEAPPGPLLGTPFALCEGEKPL